MNTESIKLSYHLNGNAPLGCSQNSLIQLLNPDRSLNIKAVAPLLEDFENGELNPKLNIFDDLKFNSTSNCFSLIEYTLKVGDLEGFLFLYDSNIKRIKSIKEKNNGFNLVDEESKETKFNSNLFDYIFYNLHFFSDDSKNKLNNKLNFFSKRNLFKVLSSSPFSSHQNKSKHAFDWVLKNTTVDMFNGHKINHKKSQIVSRFIAHAVQTLGPDEGISFLERISSSSLIKEIPNFNFNIIFMKIMTHYIDNSQNNDIQETSKVVHYFNRLKKMNIVFEEKEQDNINNTPWLNTGIKCWKELLLNEGLQKNPSIKPKVPRF